MPIRRLALLLVPIAIGLMSLALPGRAQDQSVRYAFADTTLLRDTLGVKFDRLFPLADSMRTSPDTLRALAIRYRAPLWRIVRLTDSLSVPMDSVSAVMERERFNPLAAVGRDVNTYTYTSSYGIARTSGTWTNDSNWNRISGPLVLNNITRVEFRRDHASNGTSLQQTRDMTTEAGWRLSPDFSLGGRAHLYRFDAATLGGASSDAATTNEFYAPLRFRAKPRRNLSSELNLLPGLVDLRDLRQVKRGTSAQTDGRVRYTRGTLVTGDLSGNLSGNLANTRMPTSPLELRTHDLTRSLAGAFGLLTNAPLGANLNFRLSRSTVETPLDTGRVQQLVTQDNLGDLTVRGRIDNDRLVNFGAHYSDSRRVQNNALNSVSTGQSRGVTIDGRYVLLGMEFEGQFANTFSRPEYPARGPTGGYGDRGHTRSLDGSVQRRLVGGRFILRAKGNIQLVSDRYYVIGTYPTVPADNDHYVQGYRLEGNYVRSEDLNTGIALDVQRTLAINISSDLNPSASGSNNEDRRYTAEWRWNYRLFPHLTATQFNQITADYQFYTYRPTDSRLTMNYRIVTTLTAVLSPRFDFNMTHAAIYSPGGNYTFQEDGRQALTKSDVSKGYQLNGAFNYKPSPAIAFTFAPTYNSSLRSSSQNGLLVPTRGDKSFTFSGGSQLNVAIGSRGRLTGAINRSSSSSSATNYSQGVPTLQPGVSQDYWNGSLSLTWTL